MVSIPLPHARRVLLRAQGLDGGWAPPPGAAGAADVINRLGYVQIDTIAVIERAHHHVLWTRQKDYAPVMLDELLRRDRVIFEYWTHAAAYVPLRDYRFHLPMMRDFARRPRIRSWIGENRKLLRHVLERIRAEGPLRSADFADPRGNRGGWWDWAPPKQALEVLFRTGELMIAGRRNFQRLYDLAERVLPPEVDTSPPRRDEVARHVVRRTLAAHGIVTAREAAWWLKDPKAVAAAIAEMVDDGEVMGVRIEGDADTPHYLSPATLDADFGRTASRDSVHLLSPFDNLVINRSRTLRFFGFDYRIECYTPAAKRKYGYFTLPILWGDRIVGRLDPKAERKDGRFIVRNLVLEPGFEELGELAPVITEALRDFAAFNGCGEVVVGTGIGEDRRLLEAFPMA